jgi:hypothetical protein
MLRDRGYLEGVDKSVAKFSFELNSPVASVVLVAGDAGTKLQWVRALTAAIAAAITPDRKMERGWLHAAVVGTLWAAAITGDERQARALLARSAAAQGEPTAGALDVDAVDDDGCTALHYAAHSGHTGVASALLEGGATGSLGISDNDYATPLHIAVGKGDADMVALFASNGAPLDAKNLLEQTPLSVAVTAGQGQRSAMENIVGLLLHAGADATTPDGEGFQPLHRVVLAQGPPGVIKALVRAGADPNARIHIASLASGAPPPRQRSATGASPTAGAGAATGAGSPDSSSHEAGETFTPLHLACGALDTAVARSLGIDAEDVVVDTAVTLLTFGAQPNARTSITCVTALHCLLRRMQRLKGPQAGDEHANASAYIAQLMSCASRLAAFGARMDPVDGAGVAVASLAEALGIKPALDSSYASFEARQAQPTAAVHARDLDRLLARHSFPLSAATRPHDLVSPTSPGGTGAGGARAAGTTRPQHGLGAMVGKLSASVKRMHLGHVQEPAKWTSDAAHEACSLCGSGFTLMKRRHHVWTATA